MTAPTLSLTQKQTLAAVRAFVLAAIGSDGTTVPAVKGQINRVPSPGTDDYVVMTPNGRGDIATPATTYHDGTFDQVAGPGLRADQASDEVHVQLDFHGPGSYDLSTMVHTLVRTSFATDAFAASGFDVTPLFATEPHQQPFVNENQQVETCWVFDLHLQCNPVVTNGQDFFDTVTVGLIEADSPSPSN
jgi:hypothetical protein